MRSQIIVNVVVCILLLNTSCQRHYGTQQIDKEQLIMEVEKQVWAFHAADTSMNAEQLINLLWPEFTMLVDGKYIAYEDVKIGSKEFMASLESFQSKWNDLRIIPLGNDHAISSYIFTDSIVSKNGAITQSMGPNTFVWENRNGQWKVIYADADHYPAE